MFYLDYIIDIIQAIILLDFNVLNSVGRWFVVLECTERFVYSGINIAILDLRVISRLLEYSNLYLLY